MMEEGEFTELVDGYCSGSLSEEEFARLEEALRSNPEVRRDLLESRMLESELRQFALSLEQQDRQGNHSRPNTTPVKVFPRWQAGLLTAAAAIALLLVGKWALFPNSKTPPSSPEIAEVSHDTGVAVLAREYGARWDQTALRSGDSMPPGNWVLASGTAEIQFYSGASVTLQAPAELEIVSQNGGILHRGRLRADVPRHAHGFSIKTEAVELVDLGTSFGMSVSDNADTEIHVFDGEVELFGPGGRTAAAKGDLVTAGQGRVFGKSGEGAPLAINPALFDGSARLDEKAREEFAQWNRLATMWDHDPSLLAYYDLEINDGSRRKIAARSALLDEDLLEGVIIGARWGEGRWPQKAALDFKRPSDQVRVIIPGQYRTLTMITSLRIDGLDNYYNSILLSDGWDRQGAFHWQLLRNKSVELAISGGAGGTQDLQSRAQFAFEPSDLGRWMQFAVTYDAEAGVVRHFQDGVLTGETFSDSMQPVEISSAEIGNWTPPAAQAREIRNFNGRIDEVLVFNRALSPSEVAGCYIGTAPQAIASGAADRILAIDAPAEVAPGQTVSVPVRYRVNEEHRIRLSFTLDTAPWTSFGTSEAVVSAGAGTVEIELPIDPSTPTAGPTFKFEASLIPAGGRFEDRIDSLTRPGVTAGQ